MQNPAAPVGASAGTNAVACGAEAHIYLKAVTEPLCEVRDKEMPWRSATRA